MTGTTHYAYLATDFGQSLPADPVAAVQTVASLTVTLSRAAAAARMEIGGDRLAADLRIGGQVFAAGDGAGQLWSLVDPAKGARLTAYRIEAAGGGAAPCIVIASALPLTPGQSYALSLPVGEPGAMPLAGGLAAGTRVLTRDGKSLVDDIRPGQMVWTDGDGFQPVLWHGVQTLPARGLAAPVRLRRGTLGLAEDLVLAGNQHLRIDGAAGPVLVPAAALEAAGRAGREFGATVTWHQLLLPGHRIIFAHGLPVESLWAPAVLRHGRPADWPADYAVPAAPALPRLAEAEAAAVLG
ncbi:Hint domain-containing protein [Roseicyclus persicicus]|uniref:Hedgehog/Intein (Hint) domain-containing protein n=1 Tax=Roseicyclus persicicus TaxID=2650661 RepID=A0A7X6GYD7_9RHOB|nr:Hint domain-containing protein [Roseibacterium persicicum]NKX44687.1 hypothetical protein [Roseibacterium persicicum]